MNKLLSFLLTIVTLFNLLSCSQGNSFKVAGAAIVTDTDDSPTVQLVKNLFMDDIYQVTGQRADPQSERQILVGTVGSSALIDNLVSEGKLDVSEIQNGWEQYIIEQVDPNTLVVAGCDRRGTAYGVFHLSEEIGVNPFFWWADVPVRENPRAAVSGERFVSKRPSVKYRGFFINDEDWGLRTWSGLNYEQDLGDIGPATYARVCELILRLGGNMLAPAMHSCTGAFYSYPESKEVADKYGIIITTSHCEPLLFNNAAQSEWDSERDGEWNYRTNKDVIWKKFDDRIAEAGQYENLYTIAMRGVHDTGLTGNYPPEEQVAILTEVIADQREILSRHIGKPAEEIPQIFVPYKETLDVYEYGLEVPDDVIIVWPDDNYGYMKRVSNPDEQQRSGGSGVYYHVSYLGSPHDYLWISTTPPVLMYEELKKAYDNGADRYWLLNVGDIKPAELSIKTFFDLAKDIDAYDIHSINRHQSGFLASIYGQKFRQDFQDLLDEYYRLAWSRKPEFMGWEREWDRPWLANIMDTDFSFENYAEAQQRLADYKRISDLADKLTFRIKKEYRSSFFELIGYQAKGSYQMNRKMLMAQLNHAEAAAGRTARANWAGIQSLAAYDSLEALNVIYNTQLGGQWDQMMHISPGINAKYQEMPQVTMVSEAGAEEIDLTPQPYTLDRCLTVDLRSAGEEMIEGIGYDWMSVEIKDLNFKLPAIDADSVKVHIWTIPFWPLYEGVSNRYSVSLDGSAETVVENRFAEFGESWKDQVLQNGYEAVLSFPLDRGASAHKLTLKEVDPGQIVQRIVIDWGGLLPSYIGPGFIH
jgi:hypothetical protein